MPYEQGMNVQYDKIAQTVTVHFRGEKVTLPSKYPTMEAGMKAGEDYCRKHGWQG
ncbi:hypothetical protein [Chelativorans salis]|uniref:Uncharacterized protein n=1 Tax=Chelativorans salis TaxID=2978478 RepID=A0ABT2LS83_9HYPH|nr:hypothetical protein [Chelativorans sp. EGI FJ00035]MCT7377395.1 hypothetical protein [Chelativorans sp. EGI FJ00035]